MLVNGKTTGSGVVALADTMGLMLVEALRRVGRRVPEQVGVVGIDVSTG